MNERFSDRARHALALANQEAGKLNHNFIAPGHLLLGLIAEGHCVALEALQVLDVDLHKIRDQVRKNMEQGNSTNGFGRRGQTKSTKHVIERAIAEARRFGHRYVGTEHLILALIEETDEVPSTVLSQQGVSLEKIREKVLDLLHMEVDSTHDLSHSRHGHFEWVHQQEIAKAFRSPKFWHTMILAIDSANRMGAGEVEPEHLLLGLLRDESTNATRLLHEKGVTSEWVQQRVSTGH